MEFISIFIKKLKIHKKKLYSVFTVFSIFALFVFPVYAALNSSSFLPKAKQYIDNNCNKKYLDNPTSLFCYLFYKTGEINTSLTNTQVTVATQTNQIQNLQNTVASQSAQITNLDQRVAKLENNATITPTPTPLLEPLIVSRTDGSSGGPGGYTVTWTINLQAPGHYFKIDEVDLGDVKPDVSNLSLDDSNPRHTFSENITSSDLFQHGTNPQLTIKFEDSKGNQHQTIYTIILEQDLSGHYKIISFSNPSFS